MPKRPTVKVEFQIPQLNEKQMAIVIAGLHRMLILALAEIVDIAGMKKAFEFKTRLVEHAKNAIPRGLTMDEEAETIGALVTLVENTIVSATDAKDRDGEP